MHIKKYKNKKTSYLLTKTNTPKNLIEIMCISNLKEKPIAKLENVKKNKNFLHKNELSNKLKSNNNHLNSYLNIINDKAKQSQEPNSRDNSSNNKHKNYQNMTIQPINIKKSNINVNNYSFKIQNRHKTNALYKIIRKKSYGARRYMSLSELHSNLSGNLMTRKTIFFNDQFNQNTSNHSKTKNKSSPKNKKKPIIQLENTKIDFGTIDSSDKYNFHFNKTEGNKISHHRISSKLLNKSELNFSFNLTHNKATNTNFSNNSKLIRSTENIFSYMEKSYQKKNLNKSKIFNNINDNSTNIINTTILSITKNIKDNSELDSQNNSHIISSNTKTELKTISSPTEHI